VAAPQSDRGIGIIRPIGLRPQLRWLVQLVIGDHEFRPRQSDDDVVALHFDVEVVVTVIRPILEALWLILVGQAAYIEQNPAV
jgi:hypothetical protein